MRALAILGILVGLLATATAQQRFADRRFDIKAGVLVLSSNLYTGDNPTPHVWFNLDRNSRMKPGGWSFENPRPTTTANAQMLFRWGNNPNAGPLPALGDRLTKAQAGYWEVDLGSVSDGILAEYDVLLLSARGVLTLQAAEREKLRAFVDQGGLLWIDADGSTTFDVANLVSPGFQRSTGTPGNLRADLFHPLLSTPNQLGLRELSAMQTDQSIGLQAIDLASAGLAGLTALLSPLPFEFDNYQVLVGDNSGSLLALARMGDGQILVTARGVATAVNRVRLSAGGYSPNNAFYALEPTFDSSSNAAAALVLNSLHLGSSYNQPYFGSRKLNSTRVDLGAPLLRTFRAPIELSLGPRDFIPPATYKGLTVVVGSDGMNTRLYVYDGLPSNDLDGDGNPDDGLSDSSLGEGLDLLWRSVPLDEPVSSPVGVEVPVPSGSAVRDQLLVVDNDGTLIAFDSNATGDLSEVPAAYTLEPPGGAAAFDFAVDGRGPYAPTVFEGFAYIADVQPGVGGNAGRIWIVDLSTGQLVQTGITPWSVGGSAAPGIPDISSSPTIGYIPVFDNSGAEDLVLYVPTRPNETNLGAADATAGVTSLWLGAKGESPVSVSDTGSALQVVTRASQQGLRLYLGNDELGIQVSVIYQDPVVGPRPLTGPEMTALFSGTVAQGPDGILTIGLNGTWDPAIYSLRLSYRIDWGTGIGTYTNQLIRGQLYFPDSTRTRRVLGSVALGPEGNFFVSVSNQAQGGSVYALREEGRGNFAMLYRYELYDAHTISLNQTAPVEYAELFQDQDAVNELIPLLAGRISALTLQGAPTVRGDAVYVTATGLKTAFAIPNTIVIALEADPDPIKIPVGNIGATFNVLQPDISRSVNTAIPEVYSVLQPNQYSYERIGDEGFIRITSMMSSTRGIVQQALSASQPIVLRAPGQPDVLIEPNAVGGTWSPLLWYAVVPGATTQSPALVTGDTVFAAGNSKLPDILAGVSPDMAVDRGVMFAMRANISPVAPEAISSIGRPWMKQVPLLNRGATAGTYEPNDAVLWPRAGGVLTLEEWQVRYMQTALKPGDTAYGIAGGDGALFAFGPSRLYGFSRGEFLVADEGRLVRMDAAGKVQWTSDMTRTSGGGTSGASTTTVSPLVRPSRAYPVGREIVVVDPGSNKIVRLGLSGREVRSLTSFQLDPSFRPEGYQASAPRTFNAPNDVSVFSTYVNSAQNPLSSPQPQEFWQHYIVADTGNRRIIEIVDRYRLDPATLQVLGPVEIGGVAQTGVLVWHSPAAVSGKNYEYNSLDKAFNPISGDLVYAAGIGGTQPTRTDLGQETPTTGSVRESSSGSGGIVLFDEFNTEVIGQIVIPDLGQNVLGVRRNDLTGYDFASAPVPQRIKPLRGVNSVTMRYISIDDVGTTRLAVMFTDSTGVYEIFQPTVGPDQPWQVRWMLPQEAYILMRRDNISAPSVLESDIDANPRNFRPMFARRLDSGEVLLVNGYVGRMRDNTPFNGEVLVLDGDFDPTDTLTVPGFSFTKQNLGFTQLSIRLQLKQLENARGIEAPIFADLR